MSAMSNYLENKLIDHLFRGIDYPVANTMYVALFTSSPTDTDSGAEVSGGSYGRVHYDPAYDGWKGTGNEVDTTPSSGTTGTTSNVNAITFPAPSADWGHITHFAIYDAATNGNLLFWGALTIPKTVNNGDAAPSFATGALSIQLDN